MRFSGWQSNAAERKMASRDVKLTGVRNRFGLALRTKSEIERLSDNGLGDTANEARRFAMHSVLKPDAPRPVARHVRRLHHITIGAHVPRRVTSKQRAT